MKFAFKDDAYIEGIGLILYFIDSLFNFSGADVNGYIITSRAGSTIDSLVISMNLR